MKPSEIVALIAKAEPKLEELYPDTPVSGRGRRATIRSMAVSQVAKSLGMTEAAIWKALQRSKGSKPRPKPIGTGEERFEFLGVEVTKPFRDMLTEIIRGMRVAARQLASTKTSVTKLAAKYGLPQPYLKAWLEDFESLAARTKSLQPVGICPWCKNTKSYRDSCPACYGSGWMIRAKAHAVPERLKAADVVIQNGDERKVKSLEQAADIETEERDPWEM